MAAALLISGVALGFVAARGPEPPRSLPEQVRAVASTLRCPVCQNLSVADSPSPLAREMRATIGRELTAGRTPEQIRARFVDAYGEWILLAPPRRGLNLVAWIAPAILLAAGLIAAVVAVRRWTTRRVEPVESRAGESTSRSGMPDVVSPDDRRMLEHALSALPEEPA
ncbi:MAG TPA: cytochrome c-type biogenesis protein [Actinomycetota bacterium]|nr:cytochrome c-type biogenesis protein [Actinomycetota bacterium]